MNLTLLRYKAYLTTTLLIIAYSFMHIRLSNGYVENVPIAYLRYFAGMPANWFFFLIEGLFNSLFFYTLQNLLGLEFKRKEALLLSWLFFLLLPLLFVINYRYTYHGIAPIYHPSDALSLLFFSFGFWGCLKARWILLALCIFIAAFNRGDSIVLALLIPTLYWQQGIKKTIYPFLSAIGFYLAAVFLKILLGMPIHFMDGNNHYSAFYNLYINCNWLFNNSNILLFIFCLAGLPAFWFAFHDYIPLNYRPIRLLTFMYLLGLLFCEHFSEARIFHGIVLLLYLPICVALKTWIVGLPPILFDQKSLVYFINRYFIIVSLFLLAVFSPSLSDYFT